MQSISGATCVDAWRQAAARLLADGGEVVNMILEIENPSQINQSWLNDFDPRRIRPSADYIRDVINTIFPFRLRRLVASRRDLYNRYNAIYERGKTIGRNPHRNRTAWGTYFGRLINVDGNFGRQLGGQLERNIHALSTWKQRYASALVFHLSSPHADNPKPIGAPCWQFAELIWNSDDVIDFVVVYRNHDYFNKALGNFLALGQLLEFICEESQKRPGKLVCHSIHAYFGVSQAAFGELAQL